MATEKETSGFQMYGEDVPIVWDSVVCPQSAVSILECSHDVQHDCGHNEDVACICGSPLGK